MTLREQARLEQAQVSVRVGWHTDKQVSIREKD